MRGKILTSYPDDETAKKWFDFLPASSFPCHYTSPAFFLEPFWENQNPFALLIFDEEKIVGAVTGLNRDNRIVCGLAVRPQMTIANDANEKKIVENLVAELKNFAGKENKIITIYCAERRKSFSECGLAEKKSAGSQEVIMLDLTKGADDIFKNFSQSRRSDLRKAIRQNQIQISQPENLAELRELHQIHIEWCERKNIEPDSWEMMKTVFEQKDFRRIFIAKHLGKVIAGSYFRFFPNALMEYVANNSMPEFQHLRPNDLIVWKSIEWACEQKMESYSMGGSHLFLRRFGGEIVSSYRYQLDRTFLKQHEKKEILRDLALKTYQAIPPAARRKIKSFVGKN